MSYRTVKPSFRTMTEEEYGSFPKYRTHHPIDWDHHSDKHQKMNVLQYGVEKRVNNGQGAFENSKRPSWSHGGRFGNNYAVYRCHNGNFAEYKASKNNDLRDIDTKKTMQSLNGRLTSYLENVKLLEEENVQLEQKICDWYKKNEGGFVFPDCSQYLEMITDLQSQVLSAREQNADLSQKMEDCQMTAEGYRKSHEMEHRMRTNTEEELCKHYRIQGMINQDSQDLGEHVQNLKKELLELKKTSEEEITGLQAQLGTRVNVEVETAPSIDLNATLCRIRNEYETLMERNLNDIEKMHQEMISELSREVFSGIEQLQLSNNEVTGLKLRMLTLETELKKEWSLIRAYECTLEEIRDQYRSDLSHLQNSININESHLADVQSKLKYLNYEFNVYKDLSSSLEKDIDTYNYLLERHEAMTQTHHSRKGDGTQL